MREDFEHWWNEEGQYSELCGKELCLIAWSNGEYKAQKNLTDKEIEEIANENLGDSFDCDIMWMRMFVQAILKKARE